MAGSADEGAQALPGVEGIRASYGALKRFVDDWATFDDRMKELDKRIGELSEVLDQMPARLDKVEATGESWSSRVRMVEELEPLLSRLDGQVRTLAARLSEDAARSMLKAMREIDVSARTQLDELASVEGTIEFLKMSNASLVEECRRCVESNQAFRGKLRQSVYDGVDVVKLRE